MAANIQARLALRARMAARKGVASDDTSMSLGPLLVRMAHSTADYIATTAASVVDDAEIFILAAQETHLDIVEAKAKAAKAKAK